MTIPVNQVASQPSTPPPPSQPAQTSDATSKGYIYVCRGSNDSLCKIGCTTDAPSKRLKSLRTANPTMENLLELPCEYPRQVETALHKFFAAKRRDKEWFALDEEDLKAIPRLVMELSTINVPNALEADRLKQLKSNGVMLEQSAENVPAFQAYLAARACFAKAKLMYEAEANLLRVTIGPNEGIEDLVTWSSLEKMRFDLQKFKEDHPDLCHKYTRPTLVRKLKPLGVFDDEE